MKHQMRILQGLKLAAVLAVALSMGACANNKNGMGGDAMASAAVPGSQQDFVVNVGDRVFFESDQTELSPQAMATLDKQAQWLQQYNRYTFTIEGHADERGTREYNIALGARRAQTVRDYLVSRGIAANRIVVAGFSQGCAMALMTGLRHAEKLAGIVGLSGYLPLAATLAAERHAANHDTPVFLAHGSADPVVVLQRATATRDALQALGYRVDWHEYPMTHSVCMEEIADLNAWLLRVLAP